MLEHLVGSAVEREEAPAGKEGGGTGSKFKFQLSTLSDLGEGSA